MRSESWGLERDRGDLLKATAAQPVRRIDTKREKSLAYHKTPDEESSALFRSTARWAPHSPPASSTTQHLRSVRPDVGGATQGCAQFLPDRGTSPSPAPGVRASRKMRLQGEGGGSHPQAKAKVKRLSTASNTAEQINQYRCYQEPATVLMQRGAHLSDEATSEWQLVQVQEEGQEKLTRSPPTDCAK